MTEADFLALLRAMPLHAGARGLADDVAVVAGLTVTTDTLVEGVHFLATDPAGDVAWKLVAQNLSDLAAKGATPEGVLLNYPLRRDGEVGNRVVASLAPPVKTGVQLRDGGDDGQSSLLSAIATGPRPAPGGRGSWDTDFLTGLAEAVANFAAPLLGGDTVSLPPDAPRVLTLTAFGRDAVAPARGGARAGDALWVTGTIGDAGAGLAIARGAAGPAELLAAYRRPQPRLAEGRALAPVVHAMMDVSDGLLIDAARLAAASGLAAAIDLAAVPLSDAYRAHAGDDSAARLAAATAGDDYQLLFATAPGLVPPAAATRIGVLTAGSGLTLHDAGEPLPLPDRLGFEHAG